MKFPDPQQEHEWLQQLVGDWTYEHTSDCQPGDTPQVFRGTQRTRALGKLWIIGDGTGNMPGGGAALSQLTLGFDPRTKRFVGTWVGSMMTHLWVYDGALDAERKTLMLDCEGPSFNDPNKLTKYKDIFTVLSPDHYTLTSRVLGDDAKWQEFMVAHYRRSER